MNQIFSSDGLLKKRLSNYEFRESQLKMANFIFKSLNNHENGIIEADTGTGKSMAYLFATIIYSIENGKKVAITTETRALQKQLIDKDIPIVSAILKDFFSINLKYSLCLGSFNYPCRRRFEKYLKSGAFNKNDIIYHERLRLLFKEKKVFTQFDTDVPSYLWEEIGRDPEFCDQQRCQVSSICVYQSARKEWSQADILIMNHYLFFSNIASGKSYLPLFDVVIFDEAHSLESIASKQLGFAIDHDSLLTLLHRFYNKNGWGILNDYANNNLNKKVIDLLEVVAKEAQVFFENIRSLFSEYGILQRVTEDINIATKLTDQMSVLLAILESFRDNLDDENTYMEFESVRLKLLSYNISLESFLNINNKDYVYWIERNETELLGNITLVGRPLNINSIMKSEIFSFYESSVFISATLSIKNDFSFFSNSIGFEGENCVILDSPFNYDKQMIIYLADNLPLPDNEKYSNSVAEISAKIIDITCGNCLILFTSYHMLKSVKKILEMNIPNIIFSQGEMNASKALESYIAEQGSVLMGTHSFWQGIDLPGDLLKSVIITRLPFSVPDSPLMEAKFEKFKNEGKNPFIDLQIPEAVLKMKQGVGRLIRGKNDKGIIAILDSRIILKSYGSIFTESLPVCRKVKNIDKLISTYNDLLYS